MENIQGLAAYIMTSSGKQSRRNGDAKRINDAHEITPSIRLRRGRKPETLQRFHQQRLQNWLRFANLKGDSSVELMREFKAERLDRDLDTPNLFASAPLFGRNTEEAKQRELSELQRSVCTILDGIAKNVGRENLDGQADNIGPSYTERVEAYVECQFDAQGRIAKCELTAPINGLLNALKPPPPPSRDAAEPKPAKMGAGALRIRRCPVCGRFYYAVRADKGACDEHLARARVKRGRDPELRRRYKETCRINLLVRGGMPLNKAKAEVQRKRRKRRTVQ